MQLESHATPARTTPEQRYAALHRAIERGMVSDAVWKELAEVSIALGHMEEASGCIERLEDPVVRRTLLARMRLAGPPRTAPGGHTTAPAASDAGSAPREYATAAIDDEAEPWDELPALRDHVVDAVQFLFVQHMPWVSLLTTLAFPLVIGVGGFLAAGVSPLGLAAIAALPGICVVAVVCAMGRSILLESSRGASDPPGFEGLRTLAVDAARWCAGAALVVTTLAAPVVVAYALGLGALYVAAGAVVAAALAPMAFVIAQVRGLNLALSPVRLARAVARGGLSYLGLATICWAMLAPPILLAWYVLGQPIWVQISAVGPTAVLPVFLMARMLGTWLDTRHERLGDLLIVNPKPQRAAPTAPRAAWAPAGRPKPAAAGKGRTVQAPATRLGRPGHVAGPKGHPRREETRRSSRERPVARAIEGRSPRQQRAAGALGPGSRPADPAPTARNRVHAPDRAPARHP